ncbi:MAG TPA: hypothetical protein VFM54_20630 [Micromonosporaceae bacterium]|nr:hypothetical protein [Micromonosporaceae bacterium]
MPSAGPDELPRVVLDESSLDFRDVPPPLVVGGLDQLMDTVEVVRADPAARIAVAPMWDAVRCLDECELYELLSGAYPMQVDRDTLRRTYSMLSKLPEWDEQAVGSVPTAVGINGASPAMALSVAYALALQARGRGTACLVFPPSPRRGFLPVDSADGTRGRVYFFAHAGGLPEFWRSLYSLENVAEERFFVLGSRAFPRLVFHADLSFGRFDGSYALLRDRVVEVLAALDDRFLDEYQRCKGVAHDVQAALGRYRCDLSPESPRTRRSDKLMRQRDVVHEGRTYRCEWHAKIEPHRNRIHFAVCGQELAGRLLVGVFVDHLAT